MTKKFTDPRLMYATEASLEADGSWVQIGPYEFLLARAGGANDAFLKAISNKLKPFQTAIESDTLPREMADEMVADVFAKTIIKDWKNVGDTNGEELVYSVDECVKLLIELPNLFAEIRTQATKLSNFRKKNLEAAAKN